MVQIAALLGEAFYRHAHTHIHLEKVYFKHLFKNEFGAQLWNLAWQHFLERSIYKSVFP